MIVVAGESLVDLVIDASGSMAPRAGGSAYNTARAIARLGSRCAFLGRFADDRFGSMLRAGLADDGVELLLPEPLAAPTTLALAEIGASGNASYHFYMTETAAALVSEADVARALALALAEESASASDLAGPRAFVIGSLGLLMEPIGTSIEAMVAALASDDLLVIDPNCRAAAVVDEAAYRARFDRLLARADIVKASEEDLDFLVPTVAPLLAARMLLEAGGAARAEAGRAAAAEPAGDGCGPGPSAILLTRGSEPALAVTRSGEVEVPVPAVRVADTIGAGDTLCGAFVAWWTSRGLGRAEAGSLELLARGLGLAATAASITCQRVGADPPRFDELDEATRAAWAQPV